MAAMKTYAEVLYSIDARHQAFLPSPDQLESLQAGAGWRVHAGGERLSELNGCLAPLYEHTYNVA